MRLIRTWLAKRRMAKLAEALSIAQAAYEAAVRARDTRRQHDLWPALSRAKHAMIRHEIALSMTRSKARRRARANGWRGVSFQ